MITDDYDVAISSQKISHFVNRNKKVQYWIALVMTFNDVEYHSVHSHMTCTYDL